MLRIDINFWSQERKVLLNISKRKKGIQIVMLEIAQHFLLLLPVAY